MRDKTRETVEAIDQTRMDMALVEGSLIHIERLANRNLAGKLPLQISRDSDMDDILRIIKEQRETLTRLRKGLNKARFDNAYSPLGFELESKDADPWMEDKAGVDA
jgi:hypothetical protein|tara:strand:+ start:225 stop:542 length:318 start_codon:yes stop_codon:yes gene_type:complete